MASSGSDTARTVFLNALEHADATDRQSYLDEACRGDAGLRREVEDLLRHHSSLGSFLEVGATAEDEGSGATIGPYTLQEEIGEGGFGVVYAAQQAEPIHRRVALKLIKPGMDSREILSRFSSERQALALMDHPHIARLLDAGSTPGGRPYFVMELVRGESINVYCDHARLSLPERLELFVSVCRAVQHAHQKGVIHRDLKPSNVLVGVQGGRAAPKVIDFGIAKALGQTLTEASLQTRIGHVVGTPQYMSPEQADMSTLDVDTRSDVYSLGVLLYELLTGTTPFAPASDVTFAEFGHLIRDEDPPRPSARLTGLNGRSQDVARERGTDLRRLVRSVKGELDWIVMRALEKEPTRRYQTASELADDIERFLADEPVEAGPPSAWYRVRKFSRRHRAGVIGAALALLVALLGVGVAGWLARDRAAKRHALDAAIRGALNDLAASYRAGRLPDALAALERSEGLVVGGEPSGRVRDEVLRWRRDLDMVQRLDRAHVGSAARMVQPGRADRGPSYARAPAYERAFRQFGWDLRAGPIEEVVATVQASEIRDRLVMALADWGAALPEEEATLGERLAEVVDRTDDDAWRKSLRAAIRARDASRAVALLRTPEAGRQPPATLVFALDNVVDAPNQDIFYGVMLRLLREAWRRAPDDFWLNLKLGDMLFERKQAEAAGFYRAALAVRPDAGAAHVRLGNAQEVRGDRDGAESHFRAALAIDPEDTAALTNLAMLFDDRGERKEAVELFTRVLELAPDWSAAYVNLGSCYGRMGNLPKAIEAFERAIHLDPESAMAHSNLGNAYRIMGRFDLGLPPLRKAVDLDPRYAWGWHHLGLVLARTGAIDEAIDALRKSIELAPDRAIPYNNLGHLYAQHRDLDKAIPLLKESIRLDPAYANARANLGAAYEAKGDVEAALDTYRGGIELAGEASPAAARFHLLLGSALHRSGATKEGVDHWRRGLALAPADGSAHNELAWRLATAPEPRIRDPKHAVEFAEMAVERNEAEGTFRNTLGVARYRLGDLEGAREALDASMRLRRGGDPYDWLFLAMIEARLGRSDRAREHYERSLSWIREHAPQDPELERLRAEAQGVIESAK